MTKAEQFVQAEYEYRKHVANECNRCEDGKPDHGCQELLSLIVKRERAYTEALEGS